MASEALRASVLVLNKSFVPVNLVAVERAVGMLFTDGAEVVMVEDGHLGLHDFESWLDVSRLNAAHGPNGDHREWLSTVRYDLQVPRIVRLLDYDRYPPSRVSLSRRNVLARDEHRCQYCGRRLPTGKLSVDHVVPLSRGGRTRWTNVVCACRRCNRAKGWRTPKEAGMSLLEKPREPRFDPRIRLKLRHEKYDSWRVFFSGAHGPVSAE